MSELNIPNVSRLISYLEGLAEDKFTMSHGFTFQPHLCGTASCIHGHAKFLFQDENFDELHLGMSYTQYSALTTPRGWQAESDATRQYPLSRAIRTLKHMRSEFLRTGQVVVDWDAPGQEPETIARESWTAPKAVELTAPLPVEITRLLTTFDRVEVQ